MGGRASAFAAWVWMRSQCPLWSGLGRAISVSLYRQLYIFYLSIYLSIYPYITESKSTITIKLCFDQEIPLESNEGDLIRERSGWARKRLRCVGLHGKPLPLCGGASAGYVYISLHRHVSLSLYIYIYLSVCLSVCLSFMFIISSQTLHLAAARLSKLVGHPNRIASYIVCLTTIYQSSNYVIIVYHIYIYIYS